MAVYTMELRTICQSLIGLSKPEQYPSVKSVIEQARPLLFDFDYPIFDETYKSVLETKIIRHFYMYEIGQETLGYFKFTLESKLNEIMPYYNQLYESQLLKYNPLFDVDLSRQHVLNKGVDSKTKVDSKASSTDNTVLATTSTDQSDTVSNTINTERHGGDDNVQSTIDGSNDTQNKTTNFSESTGSQDDAYNDTPQNNIQKVKDLEYLSNFRYITNTNNVDGGGTNNTLTKSSEDSNVTTTYGQTIDSSSDVNSSYDNTSKVDSTTDNKGTSTGNTDSATTISSTDNYIETVTGKQGTQSYPSLIKEFRDTFLNIDMMIIDELQGLFMLIY